MAYVLSYNPVYLPRSDACWFGLGFMRWCCGCLQGGGVVIKYKRGGGGAEILSEPRETRSFNSRNYVMEQAITGSLWYVLQSLQWKRALNDLG